MRCDINGYIIPNRCFIKYHQIDSSCVSALCVFIALGCPLIYSILINWSQTVPLFFFILPFRLLEYRVILFRNSVGIIVNKAPRVPCCRVRPMDYGEQKKKRAAKNVRITGWPSFIRRRLFSQSINHDCWAYQLIDWFPISFFSLRSFSNCTFSRRARYKSRSGVYKRQRHQNSLLKDWLSEIKEQMWLRILVFAHFKYWFSAVM